MLIFYSLRASNVSAYCLSREVGGDRLRPLHEGVCTRTQLLFAVLPVCGRCAASAASAAAADSASAAAAAVGKEGAMLAVPGPCLDVLD